MIVIPGEPEPKSSNSLLSTELFKQYAKHIIERELAWHAWLRVVRLRESCGVKSEGTTQVQVRLPPRYRSRNE